tara:strand:- start:156 stop:1163 length:1008 start_codon:yes stop_codon:yes gene_type:complete
MSKKKVVILKNDRTGDLFVSLRAINQIINKHSDQPIAIFLSNINHKFSFLFPTLEKIVIPMDLSLIIKIKVFIYILFNKIDTVYILSPKNFYYYLAFFFRKVKFYAITIKAKKSRPSKFLLKYLYKFIELDRLNIKKRKSSYEIQEKLIDSNISKNNLSNNAKKLNNFIFPKNYIFFHYKKNLFENLLGWNLQQIYSFLDFISKRYENVLFSSEFEDKEINNYFSENYNTYNFDNGEKNFFNNKNIFFLKNIDGYDLFNAVEKSTKIISPEGIISHMGYYLKKPVLALMHFNLKNRQDFINQIISCKEWFPPNNYSFIVLKKDFDRSMIKLSKRI